MTYTGHFYIGLTRGSGAPPETIHIRRTHAAQVTSPRGMFSIRLFTWSKDTSRTTVVVMQPQVASCGLTGFLRSQYDA